LSLLLVACGSPKPKSNESETKPKAKPAEPIAVATASGETTHLSEKNEKMWRIAWKAAEVVASGDVKVGTMAGVSGETFEVITVKNRAEQYISSTFEAESAEADNKANRLMLRGNVKISATNGTMLAERVEYDAKRGLYKATGRVTFESASGLIGPMDALYASSHTDTAGKAILDKVGTSENFFK